MVEINLAPWREQKKRYEMNVLKIMLAVAFVVPALLSFMIYWQAASKVNALNRRVTEKQDEMLALAGAEQAYVAMKKRNEIVGQLSHTLFRYQLSTKSLFAELIKKPIKNLCFTEMSREKNIITFSGFARSAADLTDFLQQWDARDLFSEIKIENLHRVKSDPYMRFRFQVSEKNILSLNFLNTEKQDKDAI